MSAGTLSLWIAAAFALVSLASAFRPGPGSIRETEGRRALAMASLFALVATGFLLRDLGTPELRVTFVARHVLRSMPTATRLLSIVGDPAGAGMLVAGLGPAIGLFFTRRVTGTWPVAAMAAATLVLLAAPIAGAPHALLPWTPADGQPAESVARVPLLLAFALVLPLTVGAALTTLAHALGETSEPEQVWVWSLWTTVCLFTTVLVSHQVIVDSGTARPLSVLQGRDGAWAVLMAVLLCGRLTADSRVARVRVTAALALVLASVSLVLATVSWRTWVPAAWVLLASAAVVSLSAFLVGGGVKWPRQRSVVSAALASVLVALALAPRQQHGRLDPGAALSAAGATIAHQGISVYDEQDAAVLALALEWSRGSALQLDRAEQREYNDARGSVVGGVLTSPASFATWRNTTRVWLDSAATGDRVWVTTSVEWGAWCWWLAAVLLVLEAVVRSWRSRVRPLPQSVLP